MHPFDARTRDIHVELYSISMFGVEKRVTTGTYEGPAAVHRLLALLSSDIAIC